MLRWAAALHHWRAFFLLMSLTPQMAWHSGTHLLQEVKLRSGGAQVLEGCIAEIHNITSLDISDNAQAEVTIIINALGSNTSLTKVDISGNGMGDMGAKMLAKALQINTKLRTVIWDKNNITAQGFQDIAVALEKNYTLRFMLIPMYDASQALKTNPEKTEEALQKIENYLLRNHETRKYLQEQAYRLQQGIVTSTTQQMIDRICVKVQDHLNSLRNCGEDAVQKDLKSAEPLMRDAKNSKTFEMV
ncbi:F-actin-uncapping protein LRRC16A-like [Sciurus carolinensis]|uniref:F-actin-uncapping protein LRRC16A-like n=1 Tax=Sciurus carolinensis TaxID=30640 RepID=UPI001FB463D5|nr:F-actin-uncapping protein LRRC16A-like [Sciurus carolinensis]